MGAGFGQSQVRYYIFALLFVLFDVEAVFIFPWALGLETYDVFGLVEMAIFIVILALGLRLRLAQGGAPMGLAWSSRGKIPKPLTTSSTWAASTPSGCTSGAWPAAPSRWAPPSARPATTSCASA